MRSSKKWSTFIQLMGQIWSKTYSSIKVHSWGTRTKSSCWVTKWKYYLKYLQVYFNSIVTTVVVLNGWQNNVNAHKGARWHLLSFNHIPDPMLSALHGICHLIFRITNEVVDSTVLINNVLNVFPKYFLIHYLMWLLVFKKALLLEEGIPTLPTFQIKRTKLKVQQFVQGKTMNWWNDTKSSDSWRWFPIVSYDSFLMYLSMSQEFHLLLKMCLNAFSLVLKKNTPTSTILLMQ